jgi:hypothetical protein
LHRLFKDWLRDFKLLVQVGLYELTGELLPVSGPQNQLLVQLFVLSSDCCTSFTVVLLHAIPGVKDGELNDDFHGVKEIVEGHCSILLVLGLSQCHTSFNDLDDLSFSGLGSLEFSLLLRGLLGLHKLSKSSQFFILLKVKLLDSSDEISQIKTLAEFNDECV